MREENVGGHFAAASSRPLVSEGRYQFPLGTRELKVTPFHGPKGIRPQIEQFLSQGQVPGINLLTGQAASRWAAGDHTKAVETYRTLIARDSDWANSAYVQKLDDYTDLEKRLLLTVLQETLKLNPELTP
jgi:hypothetical protein